MGTRLGLLVMFLNHKLGVIGKSHQTRPAERHHYVPPFASLLLGTLPTLLLLFIFEDGTLSMNITRNIIGQKASEIIP